MVVHTEMEADARTFATGLRIRHKDVALKITNWSKPEDVLPQDMVEMHGLDFCQLVIAEIGRMNHDEVSNFACDFSKRYKANPRDLVRALSQPISEIFSKEERERHGDTFLGLVITNCCEAMKRLEGMQREQRAGESSRATEKEITALASTSNKTVLQTSSVAASRKPIFIVKFKSL
jgi:hypothetical protein